MVKRPLEFIAGRYIAGRGIKDAIEAVRRLNSMNILAAVDNLGENVKGIEEAEASVREYLNLLDAIKDSGLRSTVSLKLTHMGLDISQALAGKNTETVIKKALEYDNFVRLDMEGSFYTQSTIDIFLELRARYPNAGIAIQSYLKRSRADIRLLIGKNASVRLVKGAYKEPPDIAYGDKKDVDENYEALMKELLLKGNRPALATHDERLINEAVRFAKERDIAKDRFEFQMLLGIKRRLQRRLADEGYNVRVYVPYGVNWLPYTMRRLRERKENIYFLIRNILD